MASHSKSEGGFVETVKTIAYALVIAGLFRTLLFQPFWIPSGSMKDTLLIGDFLFVNKMAYGYSRYSCPFSACPITGRLFGSEPARGDVVVFRHPVNGSDFIKRLVGLPGDQVQVKQGVIYINNVEMPQIPDGAFIEVNKPQGPMRNSPRCQNSPIGEGGLCQKTRYRETFPNESVHSVLNIQVGSYADDTGVFSVPEGHYFFMGDNRDNSRFSQAVGGVGFVSSEYLVGRADRIMFSSAGKSLFYVWTWRSDRFFKAVE